MDLIRLAQEERCRHGDDKHNDVSVIRFVCCETGDHVHFPQRRRARFLRPNHAPSPSSPSRFQYKTSDGPTRYRYSECRKNLAAEIGGTAYDNCGEFVAACDDSHKCAACGCHRSFHLRLEESAVAAGGPTIASAAAAAVLNAPGLAQICRSPSRCEGKEVKESPGDQIGKEKEISINGDEGNESSEKRDKRGKQQPIGGGEVVAGTKKRLKTKFTAEQTERMRKYAEKIRWKISNERGEEVDHFCAEIGVQRERFRIWINNHKNNLSSSS